MPTQGPQKHFLESYTSELSNNFRRKIRSVGNLFSINSKLLWIKEKYGINFKIYGNRSWVQGSAFRVRDRGETM